MEYQIANTLLPHMLEFFDGRVCKQYEQYRDWDKEIKMEIGLHILEAYRLVQGDGKASDHPSWTVTRTLFDSVRLAGSQLQELDLRAAAIFLPGSTSLKAEASSNQLVVSTWTAEQKGYAKRFALSVEESYPMFIAIVATMVAMSGPFSVPFEKKVIRAFVKAIVSVVAPKA